jgi:hypothetical protein
MSPVLLRVPGLDAFDLYAEPEPPDRHPGEVVEAVRAGEGDTVVGPDGGRQPAFLKELQEGADRRRLAYRLQGFAQEQEARGMVGDGERVAIAAIAKLELALEVGAPQVVG